MANTPIYRPLGNSLRMKPKGQFLIKPAGTTEWHKGGDYDEFKYSIEIEETEVYSNEFPEKTLALLDITKAEPVISFSARMLTPFLTEVQFMSAKLSGVSPSEVSEDPDAVDDTKVNVTIGAGSGSVAYGLMSKTDIRCSILFIQNSKWGAMHEVTFHDVQIRPDGDVILAADGDEFITQGFVGRCYRDLTQPAGFELGTVVQRPRV